MDGRLQVFLPARLHHLHLLKGVLLAGEGRQDQRELTLDDDGSLMGFPGQGGRQQAAGRENQQGQAVGGHGGWLW